MKADTMSDEAIRSGYKRTEIGEIPKDWEIKAFGELFDFLPTSSLPRNSLSDSGDIYYIHYGDIHTKWDYHLDFGTATVPLIASKKVTNAARLRDGDLIMVDASEDEEGVGKSVEVVNLGNRVAVAGLHTLALRSKERFLANGFKAYLQANEMVKAQIRRIATGLKVFGISKNSLTGLLLPLPGRVEQSAIAEALSDVDALLDALDRLIAKKRAIKQGTMQALLTGRVRLPGFARKPGYKRAEVGVIPNDWDVKRVRDITSSTAGGTPSTKVVTYWGGNIRWMSSGELHLKKVYDVEGRITDAGLNNSSAKLIPPRCVLVGLAGQGRTRGTVAINMVQLCTNQSIAAILPSDCFVPEYLYFNLESRYEELRNLSTGAGGRGGLNLTILNSLMIPFPPKREQAAIAQVLSDMDAEIDALEKRRAKLRAIKQGMMQELLTGRIRLVQSQQQTQEANV